jgi:hypothetical protein
LIVRHGRRAFRLSGPIFILAGFALTCLPWVVYVAGNRGDYIGQSRVFANRYELFNPRFYLNNLINERERYKPLGLFNVQDSSSFPRWGTVATLAGLPCAVAWSWFRRGTQPGVFALSIVLVVQGLLYALLLRPKFYSYTVNLWPVAVLLLSWSWLQLWDCKRRFVLQGLLLLTVFITAAEGSVQIARSIAVAGQTTPDSQFGARIAVSIPPGSRVLGYHHYWLGLSRFEYRSWALPFLLAHPKHRFPVKMSLVDALEFVGPDIVLMDRHIRGFLDELSGPLHPNHAWHGEFWLFMKEHEARLVATVEDPTYGIMQVYRLKKRA